MIKKLSRASKFIILAYATFWIGIMLTGVVMTLGGGKNATKVLSTLCAWTPLLSFIILFRKICPEEKSIFEYIKKRFSKGNIGKMAFLLILAQTVAFGIALFAVSLVKDTSFFDMIDLSVSAILINIGLALVGGATGEEMGWRGFLHFEFTGKYGIVKGSIMVGIVWSLWHCPLWFITSGYAGIELILYIIGFMISNISAAVIIGICYNKRENLLIPILIHFMFNFLAQLYTGEILALMLALAVVYLLGAIIAVKINKKAMTKIKE